MVLANALPWANSAHRLSAGELSPLKPARLAVLRRRSCSRSLRPRDRLPVDLVVRPRLRRGQLRRLRAVSVHHPDVAAVVVEVGASPDKGDLRAIRRPRRISVPALAVRDSDEPGPVGVHDIDVAGPGPLARKCNPASVGRPGWLRVVARPVREDVRRFRCHVDDRYAVRLEDAVCERYLPSVRRPSNVDVLDVRAQVRRDLPWSCRRDP